MRTIFITLFEGNEARSLLRADFLPTLLKNPSVRIVLFMKNIDRVNLYKKEFSGERIIYEVAPYSRGAIGALDKFFGKLKFLLLRTDTKTLQRKLAFKSSGNYFVYIVGSFLNFLLARRRVRRLVRWMDFKLVKNEIYAAYFEKYKPDLVFLAHLFEEPEIHLLREAKKRAVKTVGFINSWDKVTGRCIMRLLPDKIVVFNDIVKKEAMEHNEISGKDIHVSGIPHYDHYFKAGVSARKEFFRELGINSEEKLIVYAPAGRAFSDSDWDIIDLLTDLINDGSFGRARLLVRFQPNDFMDSAETQKRNNLIFDYPGIRFASKPGRGIDWDMDEKDFLRLRNTLSHSALVISYASSFAVDAAVFNRPIINIGFEIKEPKNALRAVRYFYGVAHYQNIVSAGGTRLAKTKEELANLIKGYLGNPALDEAGRKKIVSEQCKFMDGKSAERLGGFVLNLLN